MSERSASILLEDMRDAAARIARYVQGKDAAAFLADEQCEDACVRNLEIIGEEEVVRVQLESTTSDVISVRARPVRGGIAWRVVDEYPDRGEYVVKPQFSRGPLSLAELIELLDGASYNGPFEGGLPLGWNINSLECGGGDGDKEEDAA